MVLASTERCPKKRPDQVHWPPSSPSSLLALVHVFRNKCFKTLKSFIYYTARLMENKFKIGLASETAES